jgi:hypothetical protein
MVRRKLLDILVLEDFEFFGKILRGPLSTGKK